MPIPLADALAEIETALLDPGLRRAVAAGQQRSTAPDPPRIELRPVQLKAGPHLQLVTSDGKRPLIRNVPLDSAPAEVAALLAQPYKNWVVDSEHGTLQLRVTKRGEAQLHRSASAAVAGDGAHDRAKEHLLDPADKLYTVIGGTAAKRRQVDAFLRSLRATLPDARQLPQPLRIVDLGCGNAYLTFAAHRYLSALGVDAHVTGVDVREDQRARNSALAAELGMSGQVTFIAGTIGEAVVSARPDVVLALHACDTATDDALARAVRWNAKWVLAAPCCHHDIAAQLRRATPPPPYRSLLRAGILRERLADVITDTLRASILRLHGYQVEVVEFVESQHTPRNLLLRATRTDQAPTPEQKAEVISLTQQWSVEPKLGTLLAN